jgi:hypothetical protein
MGKTDASALTGFRQSPASAIMEHAASGDPLDFHDDSVPLIVAIVAWAVIGAIAGTAIVWLRRRRKARWRG